MNRLQRGLNIRFVDILKMCSSNSNELSFRLDFFENCTADVYYNEKYMGNIYERIERKNDITPSFSKDGSLRNVWVKGGGNNYESPIRNFPPHFGIQDQIQITAKNSRQDSVDVAMQLNNMFY